MTQPTEPTGTNLHRVLIVDDNHDVAESLQLLLELAGYSVKSVHSGPDALATGAAWHPMFILLDVGMPIMSGYETATRARTEAWGRAATIIALTGWGQADDIRQAIAAGFDHHFTKPVDLDALQALMKSEANPSADCS